MPRYRLQVDRHVAKRVVFRALVVVKASQCKRLARQRSKRAFPSKELVPDGVERFQHLFALVLLLPTHEDLDVRIAQPVAVHDHQISAALQVQLEHPLKVVSSLRRLRHVALLRCLLPGAHCVVSRHHATIRALHRDRRLRQLLFPSQRLLHLLLQKKLLNPGRLAFRGGHWVPCPFLARVFATAECLYLGRCRNVRIRLFGLVHRVYASRLRLGARHRDDASCPDFAWPRPRCELKRDCAISTRRARGRHGRHQRHPATPRPPIDAFFRR